MEQQANAAPQKSNKKKWLLLGLGVAITGTLTFFGWRYMKSQKVEKLDEDNGVPEENHTPPPSKPKGNDNWPLKQGSKGNNVKALQQILIGKYGKSILPKYGADGDFGSETVAALKKLALPTDIDAATFLKLVKGKGSLSGIRENVLITTQATKVWKTPKEYVNVTANVILGPEVSKKGNYSVFSNDGQHFIVRSTDTKTI